jgi:hypothetical protein
MRLLILAVCAPLNGCATTDPVTETDEVRSAMGTSCKDFRLTRDCTDFRGARRKIVIDKFPIRVAGSDSGTFVMIMDAKLAANMNPLTPNAHSKYVNESYLRIRKELASVGIAIIRTTCLRDLDQIEGYVVETDGDAYTHLMTFSSSK